MKKSFTLLELVIVIVIMGILGTISIEILQKVANNYIVQKELTKLSFKTDLTLNILSSKLKNRIKNSIIGAHCDDNGTPNGEFKALSQISEQNSSYYQVLEWLNTSIYSRRGEWIQSKKHIQPGWSGFVDLKKTVNYGNDKYKIITPDSNFTMVNQIDGNWSEEWGINGYNNVLDNNLDVLIFSGSDGRGAFNDINDSYGYYDHNATKIFAIKEINETELNLSAIDESNSTTVYEGYYIVNSAIAIVPIKDGNDYNLMLRFNYYPWKEQNYTEGNSSIIATHVTKFKFKEENGVLRLYLCMTSPNTKLKDYNLTICKEKAVF